MWTQTADTKIENKGAFVFDTNCVLRVNEGELLKASQSLETKVTSSYSTKWPNEDRYVRYLLLFQVSLDSRTNIDVSSGQMCIRVTQPQTDIRCVLRSNRQRSKIKLVGMIEEEYQSIVYVDCFPFSEPAEN